MSITSIEWADRSWNPVTGCDKVSPGCKNCYAARLSARLNRMGAPKYQVDGDPRTSGPGFGVTLHPQVLGDPLRWRKPSIVFVDSMSDLLHPEVPLDFIEAVFETVQKGPHHVFLALTKRAERLAEVEQALRWPPNLWMGVSIENKRYVGRADLLRKTGAAVKFVSAEPLLGSIAGLDLTGIDWLIAGGESGPGKRPTRPAWVRELRDRCSREETAFFFKQWGGVTAKAGGRLLDGRTWDQFPAALRGRPGADGREIQ